MKLFTLIVTVLAFQVAFAQEPPKTPISYKNAPVKSADYLKSLKLKPQKAQWFSDAIGRYHAQFIDKKKNTDITYIFINGGQYDISKRAIQASELTEEVREVIGMKLLATPGLGLYSYENQNKKYFAIELPQGNLPPHVEYFSTSGQSLDIHY
jgi:hypothetical protein